MASISIQLPNIDAEHKIEIEVKINGKSQKFHYRVELFDWEDCSPEEEKISCLKNRINSYDKHWEILQIGNPTKTNIPVMFREKTYH